MSAGNLRAWSPPAGVRAVLIAADRGKAGETSAEALRHRLIGLGVRARIALPPQPHGDWNEAAGLARGDACGLAGGSWPVLGKEEGRAGLGAL